MKIKRKIDTHLINKANHTNSVRVIYKKAGQTPTVKIIPNVFTLKKAIIKNQLDIIPYESLYIICNNKQLMKYMQPNIVLPFRSIKGDFILINIDKQEREFKGLSQEDIIWYTQDLINKSFNNNTNNILKAISKEYKQKAITYSERGFENINNTNFEKALLQVLVDIELILSKILKSEVFKNE